MTEDIQNLTAKLADETGLAILVIDESGAEVCLANNNSICEAMMSSEPCAQQCAKHCGQAFKQATAKGGSVTYECHAGLACTATPLEGSRPLVAIVGRAFTKSENYHTAAQRAISGDWGRFDSEKLFANALMNGSSASFDRALKGLGKLAAAIESQAPADEVLPIEEFKQGHPEQAIEEEQPVGEESPQIQTPQDIVTRPNREERIEPTRVAVPEERKEEKLLEQETVVWKSLLQSLLDRPYREACVSIVRFLHERYGFRSLAWLERHGAQFETVLSDGVLAGRQFRVALKSNDDRLMGALREETSLELRSTTHSGDTMTISLFPIAVGGEMRSAVAIADSLETEAAKKRMAKFCQTVATEIEILRLRDEVHRRGLLANAVERFNRSLDKIDSEAFWADMLNISAELMQAERGSLMVFDERTREFDIVAVVGANASKLKSDRRSIGKRVAEAVLRKGIPVVVGDAVKAGLTAPPSERKYKSGSFISYPFRIGDGKVGLLNVTDKVDGVAYTNLDLDLLNAIAPQFTVLINRATLISKAGEYQQLSVTDPLTGLLNRRYLRERLAEEVRRSNRSGQQLSFMMIDVDEFKPYNDKFGHAEGDKALQIVARCLKESLRGADVAVRFGGEEFSILLPQTPVSEGRVIAERIRQKIAATKFPNRQVTISIGIAGCCTKIKTPEGLIEAADKALYQAKHSGRNRVRTFDESSVVVEAEVVHRKERI